MSKKRQKRIRESAEELTLQIDANNHSVAHKIDSDLFHVDRVGSKAAKKRLSKAAEINKSGKANPVEGKRLLSKVLKKVNEKRSKLDLKFDESTPYDLWDINEEGLELRRSINHKKDSTRVAASGQSYHPSFESHQDIIAEASALEIKKADTLKSEGGGWKRFDTKNDEILRGVYDDEDEEDAVGDEGSIANKILKKKGMVTRAQRNKRRRSKEIAVGKMRQGADLKVLRSIDSLTDIVKSIDEDEKYKAAIKMVRQVKAAKVLESARNELTYVDAGMVPLTDELRGSLRTVVPKGPRLADQLTSMVLAGKATQRNRRKQKAFEKPHAAKNIVWVAKKHRET